MADTTQFAGKTVIVTGAAGGLGRAFAEGFAARGANIVVADMNEAGSQETVALVEKAGAKAIAVTTNVTQKASTDALMDAALAAFGSIDVVINNAAMYATIQRAPFYELDPDEWDRVMAVNVKGAWLVSASAFPKMTQATGRIINIASVHGLVGSAGKSAYVAAKHGIIGLTKVTALENAQTGITCNAICPGWVLTPLVQKQVDARAHDKSLSQEAAKHELLIEKQPSAEFVTPEQLGELAVFLCSPAASQVRGAAWNMDGGWAAQ